MHYLRVSGKQRLSMKIKITLRIRWRIKVVMVRQFNGITLWTCDRNIYSCFNGRKRFSFKSFLLIHESTFKFIVATCKVSITEFKLQFYFDPQVSWNKPATLCRQIILHNKLNIKLLPFVALASLLLFHNN